MHLAGIYKGRQGRLEFGSIVAAQRNTRTGHGFPSLLSTISPARGVAIAGEGNRSGTIVTRIAGENAQQMAWRCLIRLRRVVELNSEALQFTHVSVTILQRTRPQIDMHLLVHVIEHTPLYRQHRVIPKKPQTLPHISGSDLPPKPL